MRLVWSRRRWPARVGGRTQRAAIEGAQLGSGPNALLHNMVRLCKRLGEKHLGESISVARQVERAVDRLRLQQGAILRTVVSGAVLNVGTVLSVAAFPGAAAACFAVGGLVGVTALGKMLKLSSLDKKEKALSGA